MDKNEKTACRSRNLILIKSSIAFFLLNLLLIPAAWIYTPLRFRLILSLGVLNMLFYLFQMNLFDCRLSRRTEEDVTNLASFEFAFIHFFLAFALFLFILSGKMIQ